MKSKKICAIIVTYNRKQLLKECINALLTQSKKIDHVVIINNNSTDGTGDYLQKKIKKNNNISQLLMKKNIGGAGGFNAGLKWAYKKNFDYFWIMDDDTIPETNALEELIKAKEILFEKKIDVGFLSSNVFGRSGKPMNTPSISFKKSKNNYPKWGELLAEGILPVEISTFVSLLVPKKAIQKCGYPIKEFFIWGDDINFTLRISKKFNCYLIGKSKVLHKRNPEKALNIFTEPSKRRIKNFSYLYRNSSYTLRKGGEFLNIFFFFGKGLREAFLALFCKEHKLQKSFSIIKGLLLGIIFNPKIEYPSN